MNSSKIVVSGYFLLLTGILFLVSSLAGFVMTIVYLFYTITSLNGDFAYILAFFFGLFWCMTHFFIGKDLTRKGKNIVSNAESISKNPWLERSYHFSTLKNLSGRRFRGYVMFAIGIFLWILFSISCLINIFSVATILLQKNFASEYFGVWGIFFGFIPLPIYFFLGRFFIRRGKKLALVDQTNNLRSPLFYLHYLRNITVKRLLGYVLCGVGFIFLALASLSFLSVLIPAIPKMVFAIDERIGLLFFVGGLIGAAKGAIFVFVGRYILRKGKEFSVLSGEELLSIDERPPVLYLRSFWNDEEMAKLPSSIVAQSSSTSLWKRGNSLSSWIFMSVRNQEELLANQLKRIGPPIAVGMPNEELPRLGMARLHFNDDEWREKVTELINTSALVIMLAGFTDNFWWEFNTSVQNLDPKKLIILLPFETQSQSIIGVDDNVNGYFLFKKKAETILPKQLPYFAGAIIPGSNLSGLIWFDSDWNPKIYELGQAGSSLKKSLVHVLSYY